jgi:hypothetical protein
MDVKLGGVSRSSLFAHDPDTRLAARLFVALTAQMAPALLGLRGRC